MTAKDPSAPLPPALAFAHLCRAGRVTTVEDFLARDHPAGLPESDLLDLIQQELLFREARGDVPEPDEYLRRFPACARQVGALFAVNVLLGSPPPAADADAPALPNYRVEGPLGRGAIGAVYRATDEVLGRPVAIKVLRPELRDEPGPATRFWTEAEVTARLQHPGIVPVYEAGHDDHDRPYIAMKLVLGRTLDRLLADRPTPAADRARFVQVFEQVCQAVAYAHAQGIIHRDLKPANIMVGEFGEVQVMDWGLAKRLGTPTSDEPTDGYGGPSTAGSTVPPGDQTRVGDLIGTPAYAPPEQARGEHDRVGPASDVFGLGAILCEVLTGRPPFDTVELAQSGDFTGARSRLACTDADPELVAIAMNCLAPDPADRPANAAAVAHAVGDYRAHLAERVRAAELAEARSAAERKARRRTEALRLVGVAAAVLLGAAGWWWLDRQADLARDVTAAVDDGRTLRDEAVRAGGDASRTAEAERSARRAEALARGLNGRAELRQRVTDLLADLEADARDPAMVRRLEKIRVELPGLGRRDYLGPLNAAYAAAFREYGIDVLEVDVDDAARRIAGRAIRAELVEALDHWAMRNVGPEPTTGPADRLFAVAGAVDPDPWRNRLRDALRARDDPALTALGREAGATDLPATTLGAVGRAIALRSGRVADGVVLLRDARRRRPDDFWANHDLAYFLCQMKPPRHREAIPYFTAAVALRPGLAGARVNLASAYRTAGDLDTAIATHRDALVVEPGHAVAHNNLANALRERGDVREAIAHFREAGRLDPTYAAAAARLGHCLAMIGVWDEALAAAERAARLAPADPDIAVAHADALKNVGRLGDALQVLRRLLQAQEGKPLAVRVALLVRQAERLDEIGRILTDTAAEADGSGVDQWLRAWACYLTGRDREAVRLAARALAADPTREHAPSEDHDLFHVFAAVRAGLAAPAADRAQALIWLRAELARQAEQGRSTDPQHRLATRRAIRLWQEHRELAAVREPGALAALPAAERAGWEAFWLEVAGSLRQIDAPAQ